MPRVSQDHLDARRRQILGAARACFARHGYEGATVRRLEEETGLSRGAIFHHFRDKDALFLSAAEDDKSAAAQETPEGHAVRLGADGQVTHITAVNARWLIDRDGELVASLRDGRQLHLRRADLLDLLG